MGSPGGVATAADARVVGADAYRVTGTSPTQATGQVVPAVRRAQPRRYDAVHLLGPGAVGLALLRRFRGQHRRVIAVTDTTATVHDEAGLDLDAVLEWKRSGRSLSTFPGALPLRGPDAVDCIDADIVADATATDRGRHGWTAALDRALRRDACVVSAAKASLCEAGAEWLSGGLRERVGCNAVLGGTGRSFVAELPELQRHAHSVAVVGNASTTAIIDVIERGGTIGTGIDAARQLGYLEADPELDLRGTDAAVKLAIVAGAVTGRRIDPDGIACDDIRDIDVLAVRARRRRGATTRLVARLTGGSDLRVRYEEISRDSILAAPIGRVVYEYRLRRGERRFHLGSGLGPDATAGAMWSDIRSLAAGAAVRAEAGR